MAIDDERIRRGLERQFQARRARLQAGERPIGWKVGFGAPAALERFRIDGPLVGFLTDASLVPPGGEASIEGWTRPVAEPEIAVRFGADLTVADPDSVRAAIAGLGPAIELADVHPEPEDVETVLEGNIFHRGLVLGPWSEERAGGDIEGLTARVERDGREEAVTTELETLTGRLIEVVGHAARQLAAAGEKISAGDVLIAGSIVPPLQLDPGEEVRFELAPIGSVSVRLI